MTPAARRAGKRVLAWPALCVVLAAAGCGRQGVLPLTGTVERDRIDLVAEAQEPITRLVVHEGETVKAGQLILQLDPARFEYAVREAQAARDQVQARIDADETTLAEARRHFERTRALVRRQVHTQAELDAAQVGLDDARARLNADRSALAGAQSALADARLRLDRLTVRAPRGARVDALPYHAGERPPAHAVVAVLLAADSAYAQVYIPEPLRARVQVGAQATLRIDGDDHAYTGTVRYISSAAAFTPYYALNERDRSHLAYLAKVYFDGGDLSALPTGAPVSVDFPALHERVRD